jgi:capsular polysaccharide export protein
MKILCIGTLDKFSRFYLNIKEHIDSKTKDKVSLKIFSIHFSGFLYTIVRLKYSCLISLKAWILANRKRHFYNQIIHKTETYKGITFTDYISFHEKLNKSISKDALLRQALAYIDVFDSNFKNDKPDYLITIGDSRLCIEIAVALAKLQNIKCYFIEQGSFNTTFFDDVGVNANLSIRNSRNNFETSNVEFDLHSTTNKYKRSPIYRGIDILLMTLLEKTKLYPPDLKYTDLNSYRSKRSKSNQKNINIKTNQHIILLILQVPLDVNMIKHSPNFKSHTEILKSVHSNLPKDTKLIVREHPLYINKYEKSFYTYVNRHGIEIENNIPLAIALETAKVVVVNNSSVGIEAILNYKPVVVLGNAFYDNDRICLKLKTKEKLAQVLKNSLDFEPNKVAIDNFKNLLFNTVLLQGGITDKALSSSKQIANHLLANH